MTAVGKDDQEELAVYEAARLGVGLRSGLGLGFGLGLGVGLTWGPGCEGQRG